MNFKEYKYLLEKEDIKTVGKPGVEAGAEMEPEKGKFQSDIDSENPDINFDKEKALEDAEKWMVAKYGTDLYNFVNVPGMDMDSEIVRTYSIMVGDRAYTLNIRKFDGVPDGSDGEDGAEKGMVKDTLGYDILAPQIAPPESEDTQEPEL